MFRVTVLFYMIFFTLKKHMFFIFQHLPYLKDKIIFALYNYQLLQKNLMPSLVSKCSAYERKILYFVYPYINYKITFIKFVCSTFILYVFLNKLNCGK